MAGALDIDLAAAAPSYEPPAPKPRAEPLGLLSLMQALWRNPIECWAQEHFENSTVKVTLPLGDVILINEPDAIRRVLLDNAQNYRKDELQRRVLSAGLSDGLLSAEGERWQVQRRVLAPLFARRTVMAFAPAMMEGVRALVGRWSRAGEVRLDIAAEMSRLTLEILERTIFSDGLGSDAERFRLAMVTYFDTIGRIDPLDILNVPNFVPRIGRLRVRKTLRFFEAAIDRLIAARRGNTNRDGARTDILGLLLDALDPATGKAMSAAEVRSNILTFIAAGHETTANSLTWSLFLLSQSDYWRDRVRAEVRRELDGPIESLNDRLVVTRGVIEEAIRLYPPIAALSRVALGPDMLAGEAVRPGSMVVVAPYVLHRHRRLWDSPDMFDPRRFLGDERKKIDRFKYLPFGAGARTCIGSAFALQEATLALAMIMHEFDLRLAPGHAVAPLLRVTLRPAGGLPMTVARIT